MTSTFCIGCRMVTKDNGGTVEEKSGRFYKSSFCAQCNCKKSKLASVNDMANQMKDLQLEKPELKKQGGKYEKAYSEDEYEEDEYEEGDEEDDEYEEGDDEYEVYYEDER